MRSSLAVDPREEEWAWRALRRDVLHARLMLEALKRTHYRALSQERAMGITSLRDEEWMRTFERSAFNPMQPRVPAGNPDGGQWTDGGGGDGRAKPLLVGDGRGFPVNLLEEEAKGGHAIAMHVNKPDEFLKARILGSRSNLPGIISAGAIRAGSFTSLDAANKLVNATLSANSEKIDNWLKSDNWLTTPSTIAVTVENGYFGRTTGYEAYAPNDRSQPIMRDTSAVVVVISKSKTSPRGFDVDTAYPLNHED